MEGGDTNPYQLEGLSPEASEKANNFMHSQSTWCGNAVCISIVYLVFSVLVMGDMKKIAVEWNDLPADYKGTAKQLASAAAGLSSGVWVQGILGVLSTCCIGGCVVGAARKMVENRNLKMCCCIEYTCSCVYCLNGLSLCGAFGTFITIYGALGEPTHLCRTAANAVNLTAAVAPFAPASTTVGPAGSNSFAQKPELAACANAIDVFKNIVFYMSIFFFILGCCICGQSSTCAAGANFANETQEVFDREEGGGGYEAGYGQPGGAFMS